jgi:WD40 repeat protein
VWDAATGRAIAPPMQHAEAVNDVAFAPDGRTVATAGADQSARVWDAATGAPVTGPLKHDGRVVQVRFSPDGSLLAAADEGGYVHLWDPRTGARVARLNYGTATQQVAFSPDGSRLLAAGFSNFVKLFDPRAPGTPTAVLTSGSFGAFAAFSPDGGLVFTTSFDGRRLWDAAGGPVGPVLQRLPLGFGRVQPDGRWLATTDARCGRGT